MFATGPATVAAENRHHASVMTWRMVNVLTLPHLHKYHKRGASSAWATYIKAALA